MRVKFLSILGLIIIISPIFSQKYKPEDVFTEEKPLILFNFDAQGNFNNLGGQWGCFDANPNDREAYIRTRFIKDNDLHKQGYYLKVMYDVESSQPAFNGIWTKLLGADLSKFYAVQLTIKGDKEANFSDFFKIELKDKKTKIEGFVDGITSEWKKITVPFDQFEGDIESLDMKNLDEFVIVFEDWRFNQKTGAYYIDDICFIPKKGEKVKFSDIMKFKTSTSSPSGEKKEEKKKK
jgi:hypothetical protein